MQNLHNFTRGAPANHAPVFLDNAAILKSAPAVFAERPSAHVSSRFTFVPTLAVVDKMRAAGWQVTKAEQSRAVSLDGQSFAKHVLRFRQTDARPLVGDTFPEFVLYNAHNGTTAFETLLGLFRLACSNGLTVLAQDFGSVRFRHSSSSADEIVDASFKVLESSSRVAESIGEMQARQLTSGEATAFAEGAAIIRWGDIAKAPLSPTTLLRPQRREDEGSDLWTTFNRVQENIIKGGQQGRNVKGQKRTIRTIKSVNEDSRINKALWHLADALKSKGANVQECTALAVRAVDFDEIMN